MTQTRTSFILHAQNYLDLLNRCFETSILESIEALADDLKAAWHEGRNIYLCGNGGSAANAIHIANDLHFGAGACGPPPANPGLRVEALTANNGIITFKMRSQNTTSKQLFAPHPASYQFSICG